MSDDVAVVVIGRNEGERLDRCLEAVRNLGVPVVYVDSGSTDGSLEKAQGRGCAVVALDPATPFSAARARNEGFAEARRRWPSVRSIQFVDGDSELQPGWIERGRKALEERTDACAVIGILRERNPEASVYNRICDLEWRLPPGEVHTFGGIAMVRVGPFEEVGGFRVNLVAGEEPELSQRLREKGGKILSLDAPMALHDAAILRFSQWWRRAVRSGHAYAQVCWLGRGIRGRFGLRQSLRIWGWCLVIPAASVVLGILRPRWALAPAALLLLQLFRVGWSYRRRGASSGVAASYALHWFPSLVAQALGQCRFLLSLLTRRQPALMEYKAPTPGDAGGTRGA